MFDAVLVHCSTSPSPCWHT